MDFERAKLTWDGNLPQSQEYQDVYFSKDDGSAETQAVFLEPNKLSKRFETHPHTVVGELGFGTGLNFLATWSLFENRSSGAANHRLTFITTEAHLLTLDAFERAHNAFPEFADSADCLRRQLPATIKGFHQLSFDEGRVTLLLLLGDAGECLKQLEATVDAWFLDGFAPSKNPEMWTPRIFEEMARLSTVGTTLSTWCSAGAVRRGLASAGFEVQRVAGHGNKRHRTIGEMIQQPSAPSLAPWHRWPTAPPPKTAAVIGAGLAGSTIAEALTQRGVDVTVFEERDQPALGGSGNPAGLVLPPLKRGFDTLSHWQSSAYHLARRRLLAAPAASLHTIILGSNRISDREDAAIKLKAMGLPSDFIDWQDDQPTIEGIVVDPRAWCNHLLANIRVCYNTTAEPNDLDHDVVIDCRGPQALDDNTSLRSVRGQLSYLKQPTTDTGEQGLAASTYLIPSQRGPLLGATFQPNDTNPNWSDTDHEALAKTFASEFPQVKDPLLATEGRVAFRACTPDYLPIVGPIPDASAWKEAYTDALRHGRPIDNLPAATWRSRQYASTGHGSHGIAGSLLAAEMLVSHFFNGPSPVSRQLRLAVQPARFVIRGMRKS